MQELERLGVRVVSGRLGRKAGDEDDNPSSKKSSGEWNPGSMINQMEIFIVRN